MSIKPSLQSTVMVFVIAIGIISLALTSWKGEGEKYTIISKNGTYHTNTFRMYGKGVVFEDGGEDIILMGDIDIKCKSER